MRTMTSDEVQAFLVAGTRTGKLASVRADGRPHVVPVWYVLDGEDIICTTWHDTVKATNIRHDNRVALTVDEERFPYAYVLIEGTATLSNDRAELRHWAHGIAARYVPADQVTVYGERNSVRGELVLRITPTRIIAQADIAG